MRVGVIGPLYPDSFADNILHALPELGVTPVPLGPAGPMAMGGGARYLVEALVRLGAEGEQLVQRPVVRRAREARCDVIINVVQSLMPNSVLGLKYTGARVALWFPDHISNTGRMSLVASDYDALFLKDRLFVDRLSAVYGLRAYYIPEACNPDWHRPVGEFGCNEHIAVVGSVYPTRARLLLRLHAAGVPLVIYGSGFPRWLDSAPLAVLYKGHPVWREGKARVFREARGVLNNLQPAEMDSVNCRLFEATACGAAVLCERRGVLAELFQEGVEVLSFDSFGELLEQCDTLLSDPAVGRGIGDAASARALAQHTYAIRLRTMLDILT